MEQLSPPDALPAPKPRLHFPPARSSIGTQNDSTWYRIPCSVWPVWVSPPDYVPSRLLVKNSPVLAEPRTAIHDEINFQHVKLLSFCRQCVLLFQVLYLPCAKCRTESI